MVDRAKNDQLIILQNKGQQTEEKKVQPLY